MPPRKKKSAAKPAPKRRQKFPSRRVAISSTIVKDSDVDQDSENGSDEDDGFIVSNDDNQGHSDSDFSA